MVRCHTQVGGCADCQAYKQVPHGQTGSMAAVHDRTGVRYL